MNLTLTENSDYIKWAIETTKSILFYLSISLLPLGIVFNTIEIVIFQMGKFQKTTMGFFFSINSSLNIITILYLLTFVPSATFSIYLHLQSDTSCKVYYFLLRSLYQASSWLNVVITADRLLFILFPNRFKFQKNKKILTIILLGVFGIILILNIPNLMLYRNVILTKQPNSQTLMTIYCTAQPKILIARDILLISMRTFIPFILMLFMNLLLVYKVKKTRDRLKRSHNMRNEFRFVFTVIATTFIFLVIFVPNVIYIVLSDLFQNSQHFQLKQTYSAFLVLFETVSSLGYFANYSLNIFAQFTFNKAFSNQFFFLVRVLIQKKQIAIEQKNFRKK
ncbi:Neuropeptide capa receptor [Brachionus plicatilis]|uniref:Neuropeptide capa receptor n=1 Tax=Brachionus plicatilis TaxID=10195 RepID=A0A3M7PWT8_BRAPC|nr:Neuropeptide capa receptor [Brachionus plicatilis]